MGREGYSFVDGIAWDGGRVRTSIMWFRRDLRVADNPALHAASAAGKVVPLFVLDPRLLASSGRRTGRLLASLAALQSDMGAPLVIRSGDPVEVIPALVAEVGAHQVHVSGESTPYGRERDARVAARVQQLGAQVEATGSPYAVTPGRVVKASGDAYRVFTPFYKAWTELGWRAPAERPDVTWRAGVAGEKLDVPAGLEGVGERAALERWEKFVATDLTDYDEARDRPDLDRTSRLSSALKYGELHPRTLLADLESHPEWNRSGGIDRFVTELAWREFFADVLWHNPESAWRDLRADMVGMRYDEDPEPFDAWREGCTGFPLVDAGMRQLLSQGWMHNRVRMVAASFLIKDLHLWWPRGARHFLEQLADGDVASNSHGWQWVAGTGTDAAPYFRIFNPVTQGLRFDPDGEYVRRWVPELRHLAGASVHEPWFQPDGYVHGYPQRIVDHAHERREALARLAEVKGTA
jgi:deoxyribodipyrimidine photo-lyase